MQQEFRMMAR